jgi:hypothetical protein
MSMLHAEPQPSGRKHLLLTLFGLFVVSVVVLIVLRWRFNPQPNSAEFEIFKAFLQLGVISVAAAAVAMLSFDYQFQRQQNERERDRVRQADEKRREEEHERALRDAELSRRRLEYRDELLRAVFGRATQSYSAVKRARRLLRARALRQQDHVRLILTSVYDELMDVVNDAQLDFENLRRDVENSRPAFSSPDQLVIYMGAIDEYLGKLMKEYERERPGFTEEISTKHLAQFAQLGDFLGPAKESLFLTGVVHPFHDVQRLIRADLLNPQLRDIPAPDTTPTAVFPAAAGAHT